MRKPIYLTKEVLFNYGVSLLLALDALAAVALAFILVVIVVGLLSAGRVQVPCLLVVIHKLAGLVGIHIHVSWLLSLERGLNICDTSLRH